MKLANYSLLTLILLNSECFAEFSGEQKKEIEKIVRDLVDSDPDMLESSLRKGFEKKEQAKKEEANKVVKQEHKALFEDSKDPFLGNPNGSEVVVVFMDPYCGYCRKFQTTLLSLIKERKNLKVIYKAYPILSAESKLAAEEELAAHSIGRFQDFHEALYESSVRSRKDRLELAEKNKIDLVKLKNSIPGLSKSSEATAVEKQLEANKKLGKKLGINATPCFIINDELYSGFAEKEELIGLLTKKS